MTRSVSIVRFGEDRYGVYLGGHQLWTTGSWDEIADWRDVALGQGSILPSAPGEPPRQGIGFWARADLD